MNRYLKLSTPLLSLILCSALVLSSCVSRKKKGDVSKLSKFYHNLNSEYNGYYNANVLVDLSLLALSENKNDNYNEIIEVNDYVSAPDPKIVYTDLDLAIEKVTRVAALHQPGEWVDDCYVLMGKSQFLKQDYESAEETLKFFEEEFNPSNPYGKNYKRKKVNAKAASKARKKEQDRKRAEQQKEREIAQKERKKEQEQLREQRLQEREDRIAESRKQKQTETRNKDGKKVRPPKQVAVDTTSQIAAKTTNSAIPSSTVAEAKPKEEPAKITPPKPKAKEKADGSAYNEGLVWLAKTYIKLQEYSDAQLLLDKVSSQSGNTKAVQKEIYPTYAELYIKQDKFDDAITNLDLAIKHTKSKSDRARYAFVAGQLLQLMGDNRVAMDYFKKAQKWAGKDFRLRFMADLYQLKNGMMAGGRSESEARGRLEKLLKEEKNKAFRDQIYYAMAEIELNNGREVAAIEYLKKSVEANSSDQALKSEAYYKIADLSFKAERYVLAKSYYDSTAIVMAKEDSRMVEVNKKKSDLDEISKNLKIVERIDSLFKIASYSDKELREYAISKIKADRERKGIASNPGKTDPNIGNAAPPRRLTGGSTFFAYNITTVNTGKKEFTNRWGNITLEDNWRRSSKSISAGNVSNQIAANDVRAVLVDEFSEDEIKSVLIEIPTDERRKTQYTQDLAKAKYTLGTLFRDKLSHYPKSIQYLEELQVIAPDYEKKLDAYYYLYLDYSDMNTMDKANMYRTKIINEFPESKYAMILNDPAYAQTIVSEDQQLEQYYEETYNLYNAKEYSSVNQRYIKAGEMFGKDNKLMPKFTLVNAMAMGSLEGKDAYVTSLNEVIVRYPNTPEELKAKEILRFVKGDATAFTAPTAEAISTAFVAGDAELHYIAVVIFSYDNKLLQDSKISVSNFNKVYFKHENLRMGETILSKDEKTQLILVRSFKDKATAMKYYNAIVSDKAQFISPSIAEFEAYAITQGNYRTMISQKTHSSYRAFFEKSYLNR